ncbi:MAG: hypothetical protein QGI09_04345 [Dehalococcoidia bacterium]|jgi:hypothetical protein|nr:hypothetical protein [Dehalococcoidia bacterium]
MAAELVVLNPVAQRASELGEPVSAPQRPHALVGCRVGLYWNRKQGGNFALHRVEELLKERYTGVVTHLFDARRPISESLVGEINASCDVVVGATAD